MLSEALKKTIVVLIGFAGTGKYTIGRELSGRTRAKLIDNQLINNPIFTVLNVDGVTPLPKGIWGKVREVRRIVYEAISELSPPEMSFVFTIQLIEGDPADHDSFVDLVKLAEARASLLVPIRLICEVDSESIAPESQNDRCHAQFAFRKRGHDSCGNRRDRPTTRAIILSRG